MNTTLLVISSASLVCSAGTLFIMVKVARELKTAKDELETVKTKISHNAKAVKTAFSAMVV